MPVNSFSIQRFIPELTSGLITFISEGYDDSHSLSGMAKEMKPQTDPKIAIAGKVYDRRIAEDIAEASEATLIKDTKSTQEYFTAPQYGKAFGITANDLIANPEYGVAFGSVLNKGAGTTLQTRTRNAGNACIQMIRRAEDYQMKQLLDSCTLVSDDNNFLTLDFGRNVDNSKVISTSNRKWNIANAATMKPFDDLDDMCEQIADYGNAGGDEFIHVMQSTEYAAFVNCDQYKADSDQRRNYKVEKIPTFNNFNNINVPKGATYRGSILDGKVGVSHIFTYNETYSASEGTPAKWLTAGKVWTIATGNVFHRQPVMTPNMANLMPMSADMKSLIRALPQSNGWLIHPEWSKCTMQNLVIGIYRKFLTIPLTPNKTGTTTVNS